MSAPIRGCLAWLAMLACLAACATQSASLAGGEQPLPVNEQAVAFEGENNEICFSDDLLDINLPVRDEPGLSFQLTMTNKTSAPVTIYWDRVLFLDASGNRQHMIHQGLEFGQPLEALKASQVKAGGTLVVTLTPAKAVFTDNVWRLEPLGNPGETDLRLRIDLPLEVNGRESVYRFRFHLERLQPEAPTAPAPAPESGAQE